ncbi:MAG: hypothetical protein R3D05_08415 [Dongiaceae bacterium]
MSLTQLSAKSPELFYQYTIKQLVAFAGDGTLADGSKCSKELRDYLRELPAEKLFAHVEFCLANSFDKNGFVLQDLVNELGRRLDYEVENGLYQGKHGQIGWDGIWKAPNGHSIVVEVKTTDAYRINLDTGAANYRRKLIDAQQIGEESSILIVVGRQDTGDLEAQIRGSRHAWDARIISTDALVKLVELKVNSDEDETTEKIRNLLVPFEYTRLDNIIDVMFATARDASASTIENELPSAGANAEDEEDVSYKQEHTPKAILDEVRKNSIAALAQREGVSLIAHKRAQFWSGDKTVRAVCPVSKRYQSGGYWYAFHPHQRAFISEAVNGYLLLGCLDNDFTYALPSKVIEEVIPHLNTTENENRKYWHIHLQRTDSGYQLLVPKKGQKLNMKKFEIRVVRK